MALEALVDKIKADAARETEANLLLHPVVGMTRPGDIDHYTRVLDSARRGGDRLREDVRWKYGVPPTGNANYAWVQHIVHHLAPAGVAGFVLANGSPGRVTDETLVGPVTEHGFEAAAAYGVSAEAVAAYPGLPLPQIITGFGVPATVTNVIVGQPKFYEALSRLLTERPLDDWKVYLRWQLLSANAPYLAEKFDDENFRFFGTVLNGTPQQEPRWQRAAKIVDTSVGEALVLTWPAPSFRQTFVPQSVSFNRWSSSQVKAMLKNLFPRRLRKRIARCSIGYTSRTPLTRSPTPPCSAA